MVELYSLKSLNELTGIDCDVAQLEFEQSIVDQSIFASMALDANLISTDSLDMEKLHLRCETNKNDYKLTFEDSGQWTTSGMANSPDDEDVSSGAEAPPTSLLSPTPAPAHDTSNLTTWGRIRSTEPFDDKTISLPELSSQRPQSSSHSSTSQQRPASLVANFVERQPHDFEYSETYLGNGRYVDVNDNEIGFVPQSTASIQKCRRPTTTSPAAAATGSSMTSSISTGAPLKPPRRTFADLGGTSSSLLPRDDSGIEPTPLNENAPDLKFLSLPFEVPSFCQQQPGPFHVPSLDEILRQTKKSHLADLDDKLFNEKMSEFECPDSGLGSAALSGPSHIQDWPSLAMLLPKHVVDACTFFKSNTHLLTGSTNPSEKKPSSLFASRPTTSTITIPRSSSHHLSSKDTTIDSGLGGSSRSRKLCDCQTQSLITPSTTSPSPKSKLALSSKLKLHAKELSIIGLPLYKKKQNLVENVVEGVAEVVRGSSSESLAFAFEALISDGLNNGVSSWEMIRTVTSPGPATSGQGIINVVKELEACENPKSSRSQQFVKELLRLRSLDGWLSYAVLKENVLSRLYDENAFMMRANSAYRSLFWRLIESLELLVVIEQRPQRKERADSGVGAESSTWGSASRIASDSRVPKSSSIPSKLMNETMPEVSNPTSQASTPLYEEKKPFEAERPSTLHVEVESPASTAAASSQTSTPSPRAAPSPSQLDSSMSPSASMRRSRIPMPTTTTANSSLTSTLSRSRTPSIGTTMTNKTAALLNTASSPTRLPLFRKQYGYGSRAISQQRPYTTTTSSISPAMKTGGAGYSRYDARRPTSTAATTTIGLARTRKYFA